MRTVQEIMSKRDKLRNDLAILEDKFRELHSKKVDTKEDKMERGREIGTLMRDRELIRGQIEALNYMLNLDYKLTELNEDLTMVRFVSGDWRDKL